jgi:transcriptional regulator PpsR
MPDAFLVVDGERRIISANASFADFVQLASSEQARGEYVDRWLGRAGVDTDVLFANLREQGSVRRFNTVLRGDYGMANVEVSAVSVQGSEPACYGLTIRRVEREIIQSSVKDFGLPRSADQLTELVGRVPLKDLVRETTDIIERMCIEAALKLTGDNRASAAEMLGLSRQGLYMKLRRYGLGELDDGPQS